MAGEEFARRILENELGLTVVLNDDNSKPGMYDLRVGAHGTPEIAIECVGAVDSTFTETWNVGPAMGPIHLPIAGGWIVTIASGARVKVIQRSIGSLLQELDALGNYDIRVDHWLKWREVQLFDRLDSLGIESVLRYRSEGAGEVHLNMLGSGGAVDETGSSIPNWISDFLRAPARSDVIEKLRRSGAKSCHVFVLASLKGVPWSVESYLTGDLAQLPLIRPDLPPPVNEVWIVYSLGQTGLRWNGEAWLKFNARGEGIEGRPQD